MIKVYITHSCKTCRMVIDWLEENNVEFITRNIFASVISHNELREILRVSEEGFDSIISKNSKVFKNLKLDLNDLSIQEASNFIIENPSILRRPIMIDTIRENLVVGFNRDAIRVLLPKIDISPIDVPNTNINDLQDWEISNEMDKEISHYRRKAINTNVNATRTMEKIKTFDEEKIS